MPKKTKTTKTTKKKPKKTTATKKIKPKRKTTAKKPRKKAVKKTKKNSEVKKAKKPAVSKKTRKKEKDIEEIWKQELAKQKQTTSNNSPKVLESNAKKTLSRQKGTKMHLWFYVTITFFIIVGLWVISLKYNMHRADNNTPGLKDDFLYNFDELKESWHELQKNTDQLEEIKNENINSIIKNPNNLSEEEIDDIGGELFPQLKE